MAKLERLQMKSNLAGYKPLVVIRMAHFLDHGVIICKNKHTRDYLVDAIPVVGKPEEDGSVKTFGVGGLKLKGWPVTDADGKNPKITPTVTLNFKVPESTLALKMAPQELLEFALVKAGILPTGDTKTAFEEAKSFHFDKDEKDRLVFTASAAFVSELTTGNGRDVPLGHLVPGLEPVPVLSGYRRINSKTRLIYGYHVAPPKSVAAQERYQAEEKERANDSNRRNQGGQGDAGGEGGRPAGNGTA